MTKNKLTPIIIALIALLVLFSCKDNISNPQVVDEALAMFPDYAGVTIPVNIAPLNFMAEGDYDKIDVVIEGEKGKPVTVQGKVYADIPINKWKVLLAENAGSKLKFTVALKSDNTWKQYRPFYVFVSEEPIDYGLTYRLIAPGYEVYSKMGIYQRELSSFKQTPILENTIIAGSCVNCHAFNQTQPEKMSLHVRGGFGGTILMDNKEIEVLDTKTDSTIAACVYPYWHPSEKYIAYSTNLTRQVFHTGQAKLIEVLDLQSDVLVYDIEKNELISCPLLSSENYETFPVFSPDGRTLYFCCASKQDMPMEYKEARYNLCSIAFDPESRTFGNHIDTLILVDTLGKSVTFPKPSFDGKHLMYTLADYGNFTIWHPEADLYLLDLDNGNWCELDNVNSDQADSYHNWSSSSRWFVFGSRRYDGQYTHPYIAFIDENGNTGKPFLVPQKDPRLYKTSLYSYNVPEFISGPVKLDVNQTEKKLVSKERKKVNYTNIND